jgi:predicted transcriptional regulator of viral defense system
MSRQAIHRRLAAGRWQEVLPGVYRVAGAPTSEEQSLMAACLWAGPGAAVSHRAAAGLWGLLEGHSTSVEITTPRRLRHPGVVVHRVRWTRVV